VEKTMKNLLFVFALISVFSIKSSFAQNSANYRIEGHINGLADNSKIYLINGGQRKTIDSAIVMNEHFLLTGKLSEPIHTYLYYGKATKLADILLDNREIRVNGSKPVYDSVKVSGSNIDEQWKDWYRHDQRLGYQRYRINQVYEALMDKKDTANAVVLKQISSELTDDRKELLKEYVRRYHDSPSGAVLPTFCTLQHQLTQADYLEMYSTLSIPMQNTAFGKEILNQANKVKPLKK
jgi:hypothetical protein